MWSPQGGKVNPTIRYQAVDYYLGSLFSSFGLLPGEWTICGYDWHLLQEEREKNRGENQSYHRIDGNYCFVRLLLHFYTDIPAALLPAGEHAFWALQAGWPVCFFDLFLSVGALTPWAVLLCAAFPESSQASFTLVINVCCKFWSLMFRVWRIALRPPFRLAMGQMSHSFC